ncbi:hypothetical protein [Dyadobacter psychrotolerans]|uniref:hypothetical protein n=1 Tax=Dyadobacter psychrotolerans TaxID=2541721 RepID=UPI0014047CC7|nr:hypothetical protein [Dyadobacter psychrotolerans]
MILSCIPCQDKVLRVSCSANAPTINANANHRIRALLTFVPRFVFVHAALA